MRTGKWVVVTMFLAGALLVTAGAIFTWLNRREVPFNQSVIGLTDVHAGARAWAADHDGIYPPHVALLLVSPRLSVENFTDPRGPANSRWDVSTVDVRTLRLDPAEDEAGAPAVEADRARLAEAVAGEEPLPYYRFGDYYFVRLPRTWNDAALVFGWTLPDEFGRRFVVFDDGNARRIDVEMWDELWHADAARREALGLPLMLPPEPDIPSVDAGPE